MTIRAGEIRGEVPAGPVTFHLQGQVAPDGSFEWTDDGNPPSHARGSFSADKFSGTVELPCGKLGISGSRTSETTSAQARIYDGTWEANTLIPPNCLLALAALRGKSQNAVFVMIISNANVDGETRLALTDAHWSTHVGPDGMITTSVLDVKFSGNSFDGTFSPPDSGCKIPTTFHRRS